MMSKSPAGDVPVFETRRLTKNYGEARGVEDISISIDGGDIFGFLGPNGAGKTTVIRTALGFLRPTSGDVFLFGTRVQTHTDVNHERIGYLPADLRLWSGETARRISDRLLSIGSRRRDRSRRDELAERLELELDRKVKSLSLGNRQKIGLLLALQHEPDLVILDEPTSGLDPLLRRTLIRVLREFAEGGGTIIYSSHNLGEVETICSRVGILRRGRLVALKSIKEIRAEREKQLRIVFAPGTRIPEGLPPELSQYRLDKAKDSTWRVNFHGSPGELLRWLAQFNVAELTSPAISLEEAFLDYYREDLPTEAAREAQLQGESR